MAVPMAVEKRADGLSPAPSPPPRPRRRWSPAPVLGLVVIAAVVVGGTSLAGGEGRVMGTLVGALILGVIYNGMNLLSVGAFSQRIVLGAVILLAVVIDRLKRR